MRPQLVVRARAGLALGALFIAVPFAAQPVRAAAQSDAQAPLTAKVKDAHVRYGRSVVVTGRVAAGAQGTPLALEFRPRGGAWSAVASGASAAGGAYRLRARVARSGDVRVVISQGAAVRAADAASAPAQSAAHGVTVVAALRTRRTRLHVMPGRRALVSGVLGGAGAGERVSLQRRSGRGWRTVARARTGRRGAFSLRYRPHGVGSTVVRVRFAGDRDLGGARKRIGRINVYRRALASWYGPGLYGNLLGCGGRLGYNQLGVAHKSLPCGTKVTVRYRGRSVRVPVIDRGPYVGAREFDLTRATKDRIRFGGTGTVLVSH